MGLFNILFILMKPTEVNLRTFRNFVCFLPVSRNKNLVSNEFQAVWYFSFRYERDTFHATISIKQTPEESETCSLYFMHACLSATNDKNEREREGGKKLDR